MMIMNKKMEPLAKLDLIDDVQRLGLGYRFNKEIEDALHSYYVCLEETSNHQNKERRSLHEVALSFSLLRDHGYHVSPGRRTYPLFNYIPL